MSLSPDAILWIIGGLVTGLWGLLMWRLQAMENARKETREGIMKFYSTFETHVSEDRSHFDAVRRDMNENHREVLNHLIEIKGGR